MKSQTHASALRYLAIGCLVPGIACGLGSSSDVAAAPFTFGEAPNLPQHAAVAANEVLRAVIGIRDDVDDHFDDDVDEGDDDESVDDNDTVNELHRVVVRGDSNSIDAADSASVVVLDGETKNAQASELQLSGWLEDLPVEGHFDAVLSMPLEKNEPRPLVVALHGDLDKPEWACSQWRQVTDGYPFIVCPRGTHHPDYPKTDIWSFAWLQTTRHEVDNAIAAVKARYGNRVMDGPIILVGFSLGAVMASHMMREAPSQYPIAILAEGNPLRDWSGTLAKNFADGGGRKVMFACAQMECRHQSFAPVEWFQKAGAQSSMAYAGNVGHIFGPELIETLRSQWDSFVAGDSRWKPLSTDCRPSVASVATP